MERITTYAKTYVEPCLAKVLTACLIVGGFLCCILLVLTIGDRD